MKKKWLSILCVSALSILVLAALLFASACAPAAKPSTSEPIKVGVLTSFTGGVSIYGPVTQTGIDLRFDEVSHEVAGRRIEVIYEDDGSFDAVKALDNAKKLVEADNVDILLGPMVSSSWVAVAPYINEVGILEFAADWRGELDPWLPGQPRWEASVEGSLGQFAYPLGTWAYEQGNRTAITVGADYETGYQGTGAFADAFEKAGGTVVQRQWAPPGTAEWAPYLTAMEDADVAAIIVFGPDMLAWVKQGFELGVWDRTRPLLLSNDSFWEVDLAAFGDDILGLVSASDYTWRINNPVNNAFVAAWEAKTGEKPAASVGRWGYSVASVIVDMLEATNGDTTPEVMRDALMGLSTEVPGGTLTQTEEGYAIMDTYITEARKTVDGEYVWEVIESFEGVHSPGYYTKP